MKKSTNSKFLLVLIIIIFVFFIIYFFVPFAGNRFLTKTFSPLCYIQKIYQGDQYVPDWCTRIESVKIENDSKIIIINKNINKAPDIEPPVTEEPVDDQEESSASSDPTSLGGSIGFDHPIDISVDLPKDNDQLSSPFTVSGNADIDNDELFIRVIGINNNTLIEESTKASGSGDFKIEVNYEFSLTKEGFVEIFSKSVSGNEENLVRIPVKF